MSFKKILELNVFLTIHAFDAIKINSYDYLCADIMHSILKGIPIDMGAKFILAIHYAHKERDPNLNLHCWWLGYKVFGMLLHALGLPLSWHFIRAEGSIYDSCMGSSVKCNNFFSKATM